MKLNGIIITSLVELRREFQFGAFWQARMQFIRDMHPDKVYYWKDKDRENYKKVCNWILEENENIDDNKRVEGLKALSDLIGHGDIPKSEYINILGISDFSQDIIVVKNDTLKLPGKIMTQEVAIQYCKENNKHERLHKIELGKEMDMPATIHINGIEVYTLPVDECVYVTEIDGQFTRILPSKIELGDRFFFLVNKANQFMSDLSINYYLAKTYRETVENITYFEIIEGKEMTSDSKIYQPLKK